MSRRTTLEDWIRETLVDEDNDKCKGSELSALALVHMKGDVQGPEVDSIRISSAKPWKPEDIAKRFNGKARTYSQDLPGVQHFMVLAFYGTSASTEPGSFFPFAVSGASEFAGPGGTLASEGPTNQGLTQQAMRHSEAMVQLAFRQSAMLFEQMSGMNNLLVEQLNHERREAIEAYKIVKELGMEMVGKEREQQLSLATFNRETEERKELLRLAPALVNKIVGSEVIPQAVVDDSLMGALAEKLTEDDIRLLGEHLSPEVWGLIGGRLTQILEEKQLRDAKQKALIKHVNPENDAAGEVTPRRISNGEQ